MLFGDGPSCVGGNLRCLYVKKATYGLLDAPTGSDPSITARSGALAEPITVGSTRYDQTYYRDPSASFCPHPPVNTLNITSGVRITW